MSNIKLGNIIPDSIMLDTARSIVKGDTLFSSNRDNYFHWDAYGSSFYAKGLLLFPYYRGSGRYAPNIHMWPWDMMNLNQYDAYKDVNPGYSYLGYMYDGEDKNITRGLNTIINSGAPNWGWSSNADWGIAITLWTKEPNVTINGVDYTDFGESPIVIRFLDDRFDQLNWTDYNSDDVIISQDKRTVTIKRVPFDTHTALRIYDENDTSLLRTNNLMTDVFVNLDGMSYHEGQFTVGYPTSIESYDLYLGTNHVWNKQKTLENCWKKHGVVIPTNYPNSFTMNNAVCDNITVIHPLKSLISSNFFLKSIDYTTSANYTYIEVPDIKVKLNNAVVNTIVSMNLVIESGTTSTQTSWFNNTITLNGTSAELQFQTEPALLVTRVDSDIKFHYEISVTFPQDAVITNPTIIEIISNNTLYTIENGVYPSYDQLAIPFIEDYQGNVKVHTAIYNDDFWDNVKQWHDDNIYNKECFESGQMFFGSNIKGKITLKMPNNEFLYGASNFAETKITKIKFVKSSPAAYYSSPQKLFDRMRKLESIEIQWSGQSEENSSGRFVCGANNIGGMFAGCKNLTSYPSYLIKWNEYRANSLSQTISCTLADYAFEQSNLVTIPNYGNITESNRYSDENTIICANQVQRMFYKCPKLTTIGPVLDMKIVQSNDSNSGEMFYGSDNITDIRIKNLNHGDWNFIGTSGSHGNFSNLNVDSLSYLIRNLSDLHEYDVNYQYEAAVDNSFQAWQSDYKQAASYDPNWPYTMDSSVRFLCRRRYDNLQNAVCIASASFNNDAVIPDFKISGLQSEDVLYIVDRNGEPITSIDTSSTSDIVQILQKVSYIEFRLVGNPNTTSIVYITMVGGLDWSKPRIGQATIYLPKICASRLIAANLYDPLDWTAKNWTIIDEDGNVWN